MVVSEAIQTIPRLTPLADVLVVVDTEVKPVTQRTIDVSAAAGRTLATDALAPARPASALALQDGWAISADETHWRRRLCTIAANAHALARRGWTGDAGRN